MSTNAGLGSLCATILWLFGSGLAAAQTANGPAEARRWQIANFVLELRDVTADPDKGVEQGQRLEVVSDGEVKLSYEDQRIQIQGWMNAPDDVPFPPMGTNVTGGNSPQVVVQGWSGGAHCCTTVLVFDLGVQPQAIPVPVGGDYYAYLRQIAGEPGWIAVGHDGTYAYWRTSFAESPAPQLLFRFRDGRWDLAADLMRKPVPPPAQLEELAREVRGLPEWSDGVPPRLWQEALDLAYSGNLDAAEKFFDQAWREGVAGKADFGRALFSCRLRKSPVWPDIAAMNNRPAAPPEGECEDGEGG